MPPFLRSCACTGPLPAAAGLLLLVLLPAAQAQSTTTSSASSPAPASNSGTQQRTVITNDNIGRPRVTPAQHPPAPLEPQPASLVQKTPNPSSQEVANNAVEIAALQKQIRDKRKRIELLMHLFVTDERHFVQFPTDAPADPAMEARIHVEQEELRAETAACARLQARLDALSAANTSSH